MSYSAATAITSRETSYQKLGKLGSEGKRDREREILSKAVPDEVEGCVCDVSLDESVLLFIKYPAS